LQEPATGVENTPLVGRSAEISALEAVLGERAAGSAPVVVVHGEAGIGKTSLAAQFAARAAGRGSTVLWGACFEDSGPPYGPWVEVIDGHVRGESRERVLELLGDDAAVLSAVVPHAPAVGHLGSAPALSSAEGQLRLFDAFSRFFERLEDPVLVLDDMQWADSSALDLLAEVVRLVPELLIIVIFRGGRLDLADPLAIRLARVGRVRRVTYLLLEGLSRGEAGQLLERAAHERLDPDLIEAIYRETGGNPFFLGELGRHIHRQGGGWVAGEAGSWRLPETIRAAVGLRLAALSIETRRMLELAAVFTRGFGFDELQALTEVAEVELLESVEEALGAELLRSLGGERYQFAHALVRQTLYEGVSPSRRVRLQRRLAEALEGLYQDPPPRVAAEIARQYHASATLPGAERGVSYAVAAAEYARGIHASAPAVALLRLALELVPDGDDALTARVLAALAVAEAQATMPIRAVATLESVVELLERGDYGAVEIAELTCEVATAVWAVAGYSVGTAALIGRALERLDDARSLLWARLKILLTHFSEPIRSGPVSIVPFVALDPEARRIVRAHGTEGDIASTIDSVGPWSEGELDWALTQVARWRDPAARSSALARIVSRLTLHGPESPELAETLCDELDMAAEEAGALLHRATVPLFRAVLHGARGSFETAAEQIADARTLLRRLPETMHGPMLLACEVLTAQHRDPEWWRRAEELWRSATPASNPGISSPLPAGLACYAFAKGEPKAKARQLLQDVMIPGFRAAGPWDYLVAPSVAHAAAAVWELRDEDLARELLPAAQAIVAAGVPDWYMSSNDLSVARLATVLDRPEDAAVAFGRARERLEQHGQWPMRAIVDFDEALARSWRGQAGSAGLLLGAETRFEELGMSAWSERVARVRRSGGGLPDGLTGREAEVLRLVASGLTNRQVAEELVLSVHTVERHLDNSYAKIGARNRAEASAYTVRHGL
jgi:DNA-binding CsgD family transcriptional regulator